MSFQRLGIVLARLIAEPEKLQASAGNSAQANGGGDRPTPRKENNGGRSPTRDGGTARMGIDGDRPGLKALGGGTDRSPPGERRVEPGPECKGKDRGAMTPASSGFGSQREENPLILPAPADKAMGAVVRRNTGRPVPAAPIALLA